MIKQRTTRRVMQERYDIIYVGRWAGYGPVEMCKPDAYLEHILKLLPSSRLKFFGKYETSKTSQ
jgi:hypothetical protein